MALIAVLLVVLLLLGVVVLVRARASRRVTPADVAWVVGAGPGERVPSDVADVAARYLARHRRHRLVGGLLGVAFAAVVGLRWYQSVGLGLGQHSPLADVLFCGVAGVLLGALHAESFRLRPGPGPRSASLEPHPPAPLGGTVWAARGLLAASLLAAAAMLLTGWGTAALASAGAGAVLVLVAELTRGRIVGRRWPVRPEQVDRLDRGLRSFAARSVAHLELAAAVLTALWVLAWWGAAAPDPSQPLEVLLGVVDLAGLVVVVVTLRRAAPRAPRRARSGA